MNSTSGQLPKQYFREDGSTMPLGLIWRLSKKLGLLLGPIVFLYTIVRRVLKIRDPVRYARARPTGLITVSDEELNQDDRDAFVPFEGACREFGMYPVQTVRPDWIGGQSAILAYWLHSFGQIYCNVSRIEARIDSSRKARALVFACHSHLQSGVELHTAMAESPPHPELIPLNHELETMPVNVAPADVIKRHLERISGRDELVRFTNDTLLAELLRGAQETFDYYVARGIYFPVTAEEMIHLQSIADDDLPRR